MPLNAPQYLSNTLPIFRFFLYIIHIKDMLKFQLRSDLINPWPKKFVHKLAIKDSNQGFSEGVGKKRSNVPKTSSSWTDPLVFLGQILSFFSGSESTGHGLRKCGGAETSGRKVRGGGDGWLVSWLAKWSVKVFGVMSLMPCIFFYQICRLLYL